MRKIDEQNDLNSCWHKALQGELMFILLGRDAAAPVAVEAWIAERIRTGKNKPDDVEIEEAHVCARRMTEQTR